MPVTLHFQSTGTVPGNARPLVMVGKSLTVGREPDNDLMLPDPSKQVSRYHCAIEDHGGNIVVIDLSANGTFLNYGKVPLGRVPTPLSDGDILSVGSYELMVEVKGERTGAIPADLPPPYEPPVPRGRESHGDPSGTLQDFHDDGLDILDEILGEKAPLSGPGSVKRPALGDDGLLPPLGEDEDIIPAPPSRHAPGPSIAEHSPPEQEYFRPSSASNVIPEDWDDDFDALLPDSAPSTTDEVNDPFATPLPIPPEFAPEAAREFAPDVVPDLPPTSPPVQPPRSMREEAAARAFLKALGAEDLNIRDEDLAETLSRLGQVLRIMIGGMREILMTRTTIKDEFGIRQTIIGATGNNPLKFSIGVEQAVEAMVRPNRIGYLGAVDSAEQALHDIKAHQVAVISGMEAAIKGVLSQLAPEVLESQMEAGGIGGFLKGRKARYWETYEKMYAQISDQAEKDFHDLFSREFAREYQAQLERLK
jgi:type VI secretion system FHA domain protein